MKIVNYDEFIKLPKGTIYSETEPCIFGEWRIKRDTVNGDSDWFYEVLVGDFDYFEKYSDISEAYDDMEKGVDILSEGVLQRDGMYDHDRKFAIYSKEDIKKLIETLITII